LTFFQEYRGFVLDGGYFHSGGHKRLSPAKKEMLLEVDIMEDIINMSDSAIESVLDDSAYLFNQDSGVGLYWALDEKTYFVAAGEYNVEATGPTWAPRGDLFNEGYDVTFDGYAATNRSDVLKYEFVHLMICADHHESGAFFRDGTHGAPLISRAAWIFVDRIHDEEYREEYINNGLYLPLIHYCIAHELQHMIQSEPLQAAVPPSSWNGRHVVDPSENGIEDDSYDKYYIMNAGSITTNTVEYLQISNTQCGSIDLRDKETRLDQQ
jgi:hypothetical protein